MASEFQRRKVAGVFDAMDKNRRGYLTEADFQDLAARWTTLRGIEPGGEDYERLRAIMLGWWSSLSAAAEDGERVKLDDVLAVVDVLPTMTEAMTATADAMFEAIDENGDDLVSRTEYHQLIEAWNGAPTDTDATFALLDLDADGYLSHQEFRRLWTQFWSGDDPADPGTWVFGRFE
ncbi:Calcium-binding EF-hand-containing protein [Catenulispora acidiphila DSM 44928]|uniref:Calcium-binding EF-hand-containing protein n=1 Tax=Catenulispora acidiphila (strain DSM 44928 / JCM 14897 / NBRC 102108 / NRRL B-24433 / ID139908) TaxID=479433 RepID=C7Q961_CATAD|nr:EF-hand domain-containing protein [Catenulispora acidiphila]ACU72381.1 Calcium-binding EF-hand-containing protein [Catenulispora acidiphila DSM 44928]